MTRLTVFLETPAMRATSLMVGKPDFCIVTGHSANRCHWPIGHGQSGALRFEPGWATFFLTPVSRDQMDVMATALRITATDMVATMVSDVAAGEAVAVDGES